MVQHSQPKRRIARTRHIAGQPLRGGEYGVRGALVRGGNGTPATLQ